MEDLDFTFLVIHLKLIRLCKVRQDLLKTFLPDTDRRMGRGKYRDNVVNKRGPLGVRW